MLHQLIFWMCFLLYKAVSCDYFLFPVFIIWMWFKQHVYQQIRVGLSPNWVWCCCPKNLFSSWHSGETNRSKSPRLQRNHLYWRQVSKAINIGCAWLQKFWSGCTLLCCATVTPAPAVHTQENTEKVSCPLYGPISGMGLMLLQHQLHPL